MQVFIYDSCFVPTDLDFSISSITSSHHHMKKHVEGDNDNNDAKSKIYKRVEKEIAAGTSHNYIKDVKTSIKTDIVIPWKKITRGLPKGCAYAHEH